MPRNFSSNIQIWRFNSSSSIWKPLLRRGQKLLSGV